MSRLRISKIVIFLAALVPLERLAWKAFHDGLGANPVEVITHSTGDWTLILILTTLSITPLRKLTKQYWLIGMRRMIGALHAAGCARVYPDGSFVTVKPVPGDFDLLWEQDAVDIDRLDPVLIDFSAQRAAQRSKYSGECFPADFIADLGSSMTYLEFFQTDMDNNRKGIISIDLRTFP